jgi:nitrogen regulatory protein PII
MPENWTGVVFIVDRGKGNAVVDAAREAGAPGGTILQARGTATDEFLGFIPLRTSDLKELVLIIMRESLAQNIIKKVSAELSLEDPGAGIAFTFPVSNVTGLHPGH